MFKIHGQFLNSKETKLLKKVLITQYDYEGDFDYALYKSEKNRVYTITKDLSRINYEIFRINQTGVYFCEAKDDGLRLSIEGSQIIGPHAKKNVIELDAPTARLWLKGQDIDYEGSSPNFVIIKSGTDYMGSAKHKNNILLNHVPKERRIRASD